MICVKYLPHSLKLIALCFLTSSALANSHTLSYGEAQKLKAFDPYTAHEAAYHRLADLIFDSLVKIDHNGHYTPSLATSWEVSKDQKKVTFQLRKHVPWHHSSKTFIAKDVLNTIELITANSSRFPNKNRFDVIASAYSKNPHEVTIILKRMVLNPLKFFLFKILPAHSLSHLSALTPQADLPFPLPGTGPFALQSINGQGEVILDRNDKYFTQAAEFENIYVKPFIDQNIMLQSLLFGALDLATQISPAFLPQVMTNNALKTVPYSGLTYSFIAFNQKNPLLKNKNIRQALSYGINKEEMLQAFFLGEGTLISGPFPPTSWAYNFSVKPISYQPKRALNLLSKVDPKALEFSFLVPTFGKGEVIKKIALAYQSYMKAIGVKLTLKFVTWPVWKQKVLKEHDYDITIASWSFDDAINIKSLFHSSETKSWGNNFIQFKDKEVDMLLGEAELTNDPAKRLAIYKRLHAVLADKMPYTFLWSLNRHAVHQRSVKTTRINTYSFFSDIVNWKKKK